MPAPDGVADVATEARRLGEAAFPAAKALLAVATHLSSALAAALFVTPLRGLYFNGPALGGYGFWGGADPADMCAQLTGVPASTWSVGPMSGQCDALLERHFRAFAWAVCFSVYAWGAYSVASLVWFRYAVVRPMADELRSVLAVMRASPPRLSRRHIAWRPPTPPRPAKSP